MGITLRSDNVNVSFKVCSRQVLQLFALRLLDGRERRAAARSLSPVPRTALPQADPPLTWMPADDIHREAI